jgi:hypothetical protein
MKHQEKFETIRGYSPSFALSNYATFSQTKIDETVPLNITLHALPSAQ